MEENKSSSNIYEYSPEEAPSYNQNKIPYSESKNETDIPRSISSNKSFKDFYKICKAYYHELRDIHSQNENLSKDDIVVLNDLIKEINGYSSLLMKNNFIQEARRLLKICVKIVDFLLKIINYNTKEDGTERNSKNSVSALYHYPLSLKLMVLETKFDLHFNVESNYEESEKLLDEIIRIQNIIQMPRFNLGCSIFYLAIIKFMTSDLKDAENLAVEALKNFEIRPAESVSGVSENNKSSKSDKKQNDGENSLNKSMNDQSNTNSKVNQEDSQKAYIENRTTRKISTVLEFLAEVYDLKKDFKNVIACYEKAYYLNLGRYGAKNVNTEYFKIKIEIVNEQIKNNSFTGHSSNLNNSFNINNNSNMLYNTGNSGKKPFSAQKRNFTPGKKEFFSTNTSLEKVNNETPFINSSLNTNVNSMNNFNFQKNQNSIEIKGTTSTFKFIVTFTNLYEPLLIAIYDLLLNVDNENIFIKNLYFDKNQLFKYFKITGMSNSELYNESNLMR